jgi:uncharacterized protein (DUF4415 family)
MPGKLQNTPTEWIDPDEAPELTAEFFEKATPMIGGRKVTFEEYRRAVKDTGPTNCPPYDDSKVAFVFHVDTDIFAAFAATGDEWEARMNDALREWMKTNLPS